MIIAVTNQKGGVGKTTTSQALASGLHATGCKVLIIDLDPQANLSTALNVDNRQLTIYEVLKKEVGIVEAIQTTSSGDIIPANILLSAAEMEFTMLGREQLLKEALTEIQKNYDYIVIDTPPALSILTINAFTAAQKLIIPMEADMFSLQGLGQLHTTILQVKKYSNKDLEIGGILLTKHNPRTNLAKDILENLNTLIKQLNTRLFKTTIRASISIREAQISQMDIIDYAPNSNAQTDYRNFVAEFLSEVEHG